MMRARGVAFGVAIFLAGASARAFCPSYTPADTAKTQKCGVAPADGTNPTVLAWQSIFFTASGGQASWGDAGPAIGTMGDGCGSPTPSHQVPAHFPCHVLMAIAMQESAWQQFCVPDAPSNEIGEPERTIVSFDCGYGVGQVTSGMHVGETPAFDRAKVAGDPLYNLATGTLILVDKWSGTACVGDNDPDVVEDWYTAIWAYNGLAYSNNPNNPNLTAGRGPYDPNKGGSYTYQERVYGWMEHPPDAQHWSALAPAYPNRGDVGSSGAPPALPTSTCASPTSCTLVRATHASSCAPPPPDGGAPDGAAPPPPGPTPVIDAGIPDAAGPPAPFVQPQPPPDDSGCACSAPGDRGHDAHGVAGLFAVAVALLAARTRRRVHR